MSAIVSPCKLHKHECDISFYACVTHGVLSGDAVKKLENSFIDFLVITDSIPLPPEKKSKKIKVVSVAGLFAEAIKRIHLEKSISILFKFIEA